MSCVEGNEAEGSSIKLCNQILLWRHSGEAWQNSLSQGNLLCETYRVSETTESIKPLTQLKLSWGLCSVSFETTFAKAGVGASRIARACSLGPVDLQLSLEFPPQLRVQMCGVPNMQRCPDPVLSRLNWETPKRSSLKSCLVLGLKLRRLSVKIIPHKQWESPRWSPNNYSSKIRTGEVYISN